MKRKHIEIILLIIVIFLIVLTIIALCNKKSNLKVNKCILESDQSASGYVSTTTYTIYYENEIVEKVEQKEEIKSQDKNILDFFNKQYSSQYKNINSLYGGYTYEIKENKDSLVSEITIDYEKINMNKFLEDNPGMKNYVNENKKIEVNKIKEMYTNIGATCE